MPGYALDQLVTELNTMETSPNTKPGSSLSPVWYKIGAALILLVVVVLFLVFSGVVERRRMNNEVPPGGAVPGQANPALPQ